MGVEPLLGFASDGGQPGEQQLGVRPRAHGQRDVDTALSKVPELIQRLRQKQVLPATEQQQRHLDPIERRVDLQRTPERVVLSRGCQP